MRAELPPGTWCSRTKGRVYCYHQPGRGTAAPGERMRVPYTPDDPKFWSWHEERGIYGTPESGSLEEALEQWLASPSFKSKAAATQRDYTRYAEQMIDRWGSRPINGIHKSDLLEWRREMEDRPTTANHAMTVAGSFWKWAVGATLATAHPVRGIEHFDTHPEQADPWPDWALELADQKARWEFRLFVALGHYTGQRTADLVRMSLHDFHKGEIRVAIKKKHDKTIWIPIHPMLKPYLAEAQRRGSINLLPRPNGEAHTSQTWRALFWRELGREEMRPIAEAGLSPHGLRALAINTLLEAGCTTAQVAAITDQSLVVIERYARQRDQRKLARQAMGLWSKALDGTDKER